MIYLDYSATTPISYDVLDSFDKASKEFIGNPNSLHGLGVKSRELMNSATNQKFFIRVVQQKRIIWL